MASSKFGDVKVPIRATTEDLPGDLRKARGLFDGAFGQIAKSAAGVFGGLTADRLFQKALQGIGAVVADMAEAERAMLQTEARIRSTGAAAGVTAEAISQMAGELARLSGGDDAVIQSGQNLLLTFTNIRNEVGAGNDIFDQATKTALDMAVAFGGGPGGMTSAALQLGKALNDPVQGVTALQRVGVSFTKAQREQIATLQASGRIVEAQKLILKELETQVGGSAEAYGQTFTGAVNRAKEAMIGLGAALGEESGGFDLAKAAIRGVAEEFENLARIVKTQGLGQAFKRASLTVAGTAMEMVGLDSSGVAGVAGAIDRRGGLTDGPIDRVGRATPRATIARAESDAMIAERQRAADALARIDGAMLQSESDARRQALDSFKAIEAERVRIAQAAREAETAETERAQAAHERLAGAMTDTERTARQNARAIKQQADAAKAAEDDFSDLASVLHSVAGLVGQAAGGGQAGAALSSLAGLLGNFDAIKKQFGKEGTFAGRFAVGTAFGQTASTITGGPEGGGAAGAIGSLAGTAIGSAFGPVGAMVGGALGGAVGGLFGKKKKQFELPPEFKATLDSISTLSKEGIVNLTDLAETYAEQLRQIKSTSQVEGGRAAKAFLDAFVKIAGKLSSGVSSALGSGINDFLLGRNGDLLGSLRTGIMEAVVGGFTDSLIKKTVMEGALGDLLGQLSEQLANKQDTSATVAAIGEAVGPLTDTLLATLQPLRQVFADAFSGRAPGLGNVDRDIPLLDEGGLVTRSGAAIVHEAEVVGLPAKLAGLAGAAMPGPVTIIMETDSRITTRKVLERLPRELRIKGVPL